MNTYYNYARLEPSVGTCPCRFQWGCSTEHSRMTAVALPCRFWWKLALTGVGRTLAASVGPGIFGNRLAAANGSMAIFVF